MHSLKGKKKHFDKNDNLKTVKISAFLLFVFSVLLTIGFAAFNTVLDIDSLSAFVTIDRDIRITKFSLYETQGNAVSNWNEHTKTSVSTNIDLPNNNSSVKYEVEITNLGNIEMGVLKIEGLPEGLEYQIDGYTLKDELCDNNDPSKCKLGSKTKFYITFTKSDGSYPGTGDNFDVNLNFFFKRFYSITYVNVNTTNLPTRALESDDIVINFNTPYPDSVEVTGNNNYTYTSSNGELALNNINDDIIITFLAKSYFVQYDGNNNMFNQISKTNLKKFYRNTTLTLEQVLEKYNNNEAFIVSTASDDANYPSYKEIYAWVENNELNWWSESNVVYFHPGTRNAFRNIATLLDVDLNGTSTSLVENFSNWFDKDNKLEYIHGKINTSGLKIPTTSYNFATDSTDNNSSGVSLAFMFNDCKALKSIDLSEFDTHNAIDMKRMFGGCTNLTSIDVSNFDTSNVKSMYWMFRNMTKLTELDIRNFNTSNVENMTGMFLSSTVKIIKLGENFNTANVRKFNNMFNNLRQLETIYAYSDFQTDNMTSSTSMFANNSKLVGSKDTLDETPFSSSHTNHEYARLAQNGTSGYFTPYTEKRMYTITYSLDGGVANNPTFYYEDDETFTLQEPTKGGYSFIGWTGSNGENIQRTVTIPTGTTGDLHYVAHYENSETFPVVFSVPGPCNFGGSNEPITGDECKSSLSDGTDYTGSTYIDSGVSLYDHDHYTQDFEVYFEISDYDPAQQEVMPDGNKQNTLFNSKIEINVLNPGLVLRKAGDELELKSNGISKRFPAATVNSVKIIRMNRKIYYSINGSNLYFLDDTSNSDNYFDLNVWFGASQTADGQPFRHVNCTLSNIYIKLGTYY